MLLAWKINGHNGAAMVTEEQFDAYCKERGIEEKADRVLLEDRISLGNHLAGLMRFCPSICTHDSSQMAGSFKWTVC
jgi:hypothetical protein